jgi:hypothetical protein
VLCAQPCDGNCPNCGRVANYGYGPTRPYTNYTGCPGYCPTCKHVVCAGGQCKSCNQPPWPGFLGGYDYRTTFNYPWSQEPCYPLPLALMHGELAEPGEIEEIMPNTAVPEIFDNSQNASPRRAPLAMKSVKRMPPRAQDRQAEVIKTSPRMLLR